MKGSVRRLDICRARALRTLAAGGIAGIALLATACATNVKPLPEDGTATRAAERYEIGPGDGLSVKLFYTSELNEDVMVRPDGRVSLPLVGEVQAAGRTPEELSQDMRQRYDAYLEKPDVVVIVRSFGSQRAYVGGEVKVPSMVTIDGRTSVVDAVFATGGALDTAALSSVVLIRRGPNGREAYSVDLSNVLVGIGEAPILRPYDVVYVPKSFIAKVGTFVDLYINRLIPRNAAFTAIYEIDKNPEAAFGAIAP